MAQVSLPEEMKTIILHISDSSKVNLNNTKCSVRNYNDELKVTSKESTESEKECNQLKSDR